MLGPATLGGPELVSRLRRNARVVFAACAFLLLSACARDSERAIRSYLDQWFYLGPTYYFESHMRCTGAMVSVTVSQTRPDLKVEHSLEAAVAARHSRGVIAIQMNGATPAEMADALLLVGTGSLGRQTLAAAALAGPCFDSIEMRQFFHEALTRPNSMLAFDTESGGLMILDPYRSRLFYVAGDIW